MLQLCEKRTERALSQVLDDLDVLSAARLGATCSALRCCVAAHIPAALVGQKLLRLQKTVRASQQALHRLAGRDLSWRDHVIAGLRHRAAAADQVAEAKWRRLTAEASVSALGCSCVVVLFVR